MLHANFHAFGVPVGDLFSIALNVVGELPDDQPIPAAYFKSVIGRDLLTGRHPSHRPFTFRNEAAHIFNSNHFVYTRDRSEAFFTRWLLLHFKNSRIGRDSTIETDLASRIVAQELPAIMAWALTGAQRLHRRGQFPITRAHRRLMDKWRVHTDPIVEFLTDPDACVLQGDAADDMSMDGFKVKRSLVYAAYEAWCRASNRKPVRKLKFNEELESPALAAMGVRVKRDAASGEMVQGLHVWHPSSRPVNLTTDDLIDLFV